MILNLTDPFFNKDPFDIYTRYKISLDEWNTIWYKRKFLNYRLDELVEYINVIQKKKLTQKQLSRLLMRYEVYLLTQVLLKRNEITVHITYFPRNLTTFIKDYYHGK